jgi:predicted lipid-binding transport protein (Tim44 family)
MTSAVVLRTQFAAIRAAQDQEESAKDDKVSNVSEQQQKIDEADAMRQQVVQSEEDQLHTSFFGGLLGGILGALGGGLIGALIGDKIGKIAASVVTLGDADTQANAQKGAEQAELTITKAKVAAHDSSP